MSNRMQLLVVSNMYPDGKHPEYGTFVRRFVDLCELNEFACNLSVMHKTEGVISKCIKYTAFYFGTFMKCLRAKCDIVYVHYASNSAPPVLAAAKFRHLRIWTNVHGSDIVPERNKQEFFTRFARKLLKSSEKVVVPSRYFKRVVEDQYEISGDSIVVYPSSGVDEGLFAYADSEKRARIRLSFGLSDTVLVVGFVGRLVPGKGWETFLDICSELPNEGYRFVVVGDGPDRQRYAAAIKKRGLQDRILTFPLMSQSKLVEIYQMCDLLCCCSSRKAESLCLVTIESLCCGTPVIASDIEVQKEYVVEGVNGFLYPQNDWKKAVDKILLFDDMPLEEKVAMRMRSRDSSGPYQTSSCIKMLNDLLESGK